MADSVTFYACRPRHYYTDIVPPPRQQTDVAPGGVVSAPGYRLHGDRSGRHKTATRRHRPQLRPSVARCASATCTTTTHHRGDGGGGGGVKSEKLSFYIITLFTRARLIVCIRLRLSSIYVYVPTTISSEIFLVRFASIKRKRRRVSRTLFI